jgi:hypothetical protein
MKKISILTLSLALSMGLANAAIVLQDDAVFMDGGKETLTDAEIGGLDVSSGDKLVVTIGLEGNDSGPNSTVTYNSQNMTLAASNVGLNGTNPSGWIGIYYLDNISTVGAGTLDFTNGGYSAGVSFMVLSGTASGVGNVNSANATTLNLGVSANSFMVAAFGDTADQAVTVDSPLTKLLDSDELPGNDGSASYGTGYQLISSAGTATPSFTSSSSRPNMVAAEFTAVPEPSTILLLGALGSLVFLRRRR